MEYLSIAALLLALLAWFRAGSLQAKVRHLETELEWVKRQSGISSTQPAQELTGQVTYGQTPPENSGDPLQERLLFLIRNNQKIKAIKELRIATNLSLAEAKREIDKLEQTSNTYHSG